MILLKGQPIEDWEKWIDEELTPPYGEAVENHPQVKYAMEAFQELIKKTKNDTSNNH